MRICCVVLSSLIVIATSVSAQSTPKECGLSETISECWSRVRDEYVPLVKREAVTERAKGQPTAPLDPALARSVKDFLPRFASGLSVPNDRKGALAVQYNTPHAGLLSGGRAQITGVLEQPQPYSALIEAVSEAQRAAATKAIADGLRDIDDIDVSISWNFENRSMGRTLAPHRSDLDSIFAAGQLGGLAPTLLLAPLYRAFPDNRVESSSCADEALVVEWKLECASTDFLAIIRATVDRSARAAARQEAVARAALDASGLFTVPFLIHNQPQVHVTFGARYTDRLVGPRRGYAELTFETGEANMGSLRQHCLATMRIRHVSQECLIDYLSQETVRSALRSVNRFAVNIGVTYFAAYEADLPSFGASISERASWQTRLGATWGRFIGVPDEGSSSASGRIEAGMEFVYHPGSDLHNKDRLRGTVSYTHRINDEMSLTTGFVAANRSEVRGDVDWPVSARMGFKYKLAGQQ